MTDTIPRQAVIDAIAPLKSNGADHESCIYNQALDEAIAAINVIPAVTVTDDMLERALVEWRKNLRLHTTSDDFGDPVFRSTAPEAMKAALFAALGE